MKGVFIIASQLITIYKLIVGFAPFTEHRHVESPVCMQLFERLSNAGYKP